MKKQLVILFAIVFIIASCDNNYDFEPTLSDDDQPIIDNNEGEYNDQEEEGSLTLYRISGDEVTKIKDYPIASNLQSFQQDYAKHLKMWDFVTRLLPLEDRGKITEFEVFHGNGELLGFVTPIDPSDLSKWRFALAIDAADQIEDINFKDLFTYVTLHEYGHVITLNNDQINVSYNNCGSSYFTGEGCSDPNSYINRLYNLGWADIYQELDEENPYALYDKYKDRFVSDYAATNPGEDIAEVFSFFVTNQNAPTGNSIADQKINILYEYPELVELRRKIRANGNVPVQRIGNWRDNPMYSKIRICSRKGCRKH